MENKFENFIQSNSPDGGFLQSEEWRKFQESVGRKTYSITGDSMYASIIEHSLPVVGKYFYVPRGPIFNFQFSIFPPKADQPRADNQFSSDNEKIFKQNIQELINLAKEEKAGWIRVEPANNEILEIIKKNIETNFKFVRAPHDMQPREVFILDIKKSEEELLAEMKSKTRYNIRLAEKKGVKISNFQFPISNEIQNTDDQNSKYISEFIRLVKITAKRDGITSHPENYYRQMFEIIPSDILKLYVAEYEGKIIAANIVICYEKTATYLHGASDNEYRNVMAPYLLQWQAIQDAKAAGFEKYDFGGISTNYEFYETTKKWQGITKFKTGFAPDTKSVEFPGSYDIIINSYKYSIYRCLQVAKSLFR